MESKDLCRNINEEVSSFRYGFVQFKRKSAVSVALKTLQHKMLDGHSLELKRSTRATSDGNQEVTVNARLRDG